MRSKQKRFLFRNLFCIKDDSYEKNEIVLEYIKNLPEGTKISVRGLAQTLHISEGTAYKAIKDAENLMLVTTIPR